MCFELGFLQFAYEFSWNLISGTARPHHGDRPRKHYKTKTSFTLSWVLIMYNKLQETNGHPTTNWHVFTMPKGKLLGKICMKIPKWHDNVQGRE